MSSTHKAPRFWVTYGPILLGAFLLSFGLYNIHERTAVTEGGVLGMSLFLQHWFDISPALSNPIMDGICYLVGFKFLGKTFAKYAITASLSFAGFHWIWEQFPPLLPDFSDMPLVAAVLGAIFVGVGVGLVVRIGGACGGDDALALALSHVTSQPISRCYLCTDLVVLALSLSYIPITRLAYSLVTVTLSSLIIGKILVWGK